MKQGILYESREKTVKEIEVSRILQVAKPVGIWAIKIGLGLTFFSLIGFLWIYWPLLDAEVRYQQQDTKIQELTDIEVKENISLDTKIDNTYKIFIPKIGAEAEVIPDIDPFDKRAYLKALLEGVVEAKGLSHPGESGTTFLFAHSVGNRVDFARYNAVFYLLDKLVVNDRIYIKYNGNNFDYEVINKEVLRANDLKYLQPQEMEEKLVLQTCYPPGTSWKRLVVIGKRI